MARVLLALLLISGCGADEVPAFPEHPPRQDPETRHIASDAAVAAFLRKEATHPSIDCGVGRDPESDARVYDCGSQAIAAHRSFFAQYVPNLPERVGIGDVVTPLPPQFLAAGYVYDARSSSLSGVTATASEERVTKRILTVGPDAPPMGFVRGMHPPTLTRSVAGPSPSREINGIVLIECVIDSSGRPTRPKVVKPLPQGVDRAAVTLLNDVRFEPARLFGLPVPVVWSVTVHSEDGKIYVAAAK